MSEFRSVEHAKILAEIWIAAYTSEKRSNLSHSTSKLAEERKTAATEAVRAFDEIVKDVTE